MIKREIVIFVIVGSLTVLIDLLVYRGLVLSKLVNIDWAKALGFLTGTLFAYVANRFWTFNQKQYIKGQISRFVMLYVTTCFGNVIVNTMMLRCMGDNSIAIFIAFLSATGMSACLNFIGMKYVVFNTARSIQECT